MERLEKAVIAWARDRKIIQRSTPEAQYVKLQEEMAELLTSIVNGDSPIDDIGDCMVVLTIIANMNGLNLKECYKHAYKDIRHRTGTLNENGIFVKDC